MPAAFTRFAPGWRTLGLAVALPASLAVFSPATFAADVVVVRDELATLPALLDLADAMLDLADQLDRDGNAFMSDADPG